jgi:Glyoxalase/Bleomycin resistance protein/Dioxygenase superfamily
MAGVGCEVVHSVTGFLGVYEVAMEERSGSRRQRRGRHRGRGVGEYGLQQQGRLLLYGPDDPLQYDIAGNLGNGKLGFALLQDTPLGAGKRWVVVAPQGSNGSGLLLAQAADERQRQAIGLQAGGRVFLFLYTDDFRRDHAAFKDRGVVFVEEPRLEPYGTVAVFTDLYGNRWDLIEPAASDSGAPA